MKQKYLLIALLLLGSGCERIDGGGDPGPAQYYALKAVTITKDSLRNSVHSEATRDLHSAGKIYVYKNYLFVVEPRAGVHIFNNADPANPVNLSFITIPAIGDVAVKDNTLYADNAIDLIALDISNPSS